MEDMEINTSKRLEHFKTGIFTALNEKRDELAAKGGKVYNFFFGTPDFPVFPHIKQAFLDAAKDPENYHYSLHDLPEMLEAVKDYYFERFGVEISTDENEKNLSPLVLEINAFPSSIVAYLIL